MPPCRTSNTPSPTNLKERIAALQQRSTSPQPLSVRPEPTSSPKGSLRDKIAKFERKGGVPVPRGSFGLGTPPVEDRPALKAQFYGNRMPSLGVKPPGRQPSPMQSRSNSLSLLSSTLNAQGLASPSPSDDVDSSLPESASATSPTIDFQGSIGDGEESNERDDYFNDASSPVLPLEETNSPIADDMSLTLSHTPSKDVTKSASSGTIPALQADYTADQTAESASDLPTVDVTSEVCFESIIQFEPF